MAADSWWGDPGWSRFAQRAGRHQVRRLLVLDGEGAVCADAPLLISTPDTGSLFYDAPKMIGDERAFGDADRLSATDRERYDSLRLRLPPIRAAQHPTVSLTAFGPHHGVRIAPRSRIPREAVFAALPGLLAAAADELGCRSSGLLHLGAAEHAAMADTAAAQGYTPVLLGADTVFELPDGADYDTWLASLRSRRRTRLRKELQDYRSQDIRTVVRQGPEAFTDELVELQAQLRAKHGVPTDPAAVRVEFDAIRDTVGEACVVFTAESDGKVLGFVLGLLDPGRRVLHARSAGFSPEAMAASCYFVLVYHDVPAWALDRGVRRVRFGMSTYEAKRARGCALEPLSGYVRFSGPDAAVPHLAAEVQSRTEAGRLTALGAEVRW
ncbi:GNAT family N-acetyltransferase [Kitasatospora sp. MAP5-34]|uniref:GNAT family N-acetyltransferase n=1 Tax=Kitasatospora sp. MAP5-34 TaxID=3035102 RepID=UPI002473F0F4|nr:GNAT family N-acetyltransferase [Kitasatospora sp. MAP5-34]MDH6574585.1 hypothetical protein [Kitasatospora sp. MAP5-34]